MTDDYRPPTGNCQLPTANWQLPTANWQLPTANCQLSTANCQLPTANCQLPTANYQLLTANCQLPTANCQLLTANCQLLTANCQLPTANCQLRVLAAIPCFNEQNFIGDVVTRARKYVDKVIVIDDGSTDDTAKVAHAAGAKVIRHEANKGYGESIQSCFQAAKRSNADILVTLDGDGQHNPDDIPELLTPILNGEADLVIGSRFLPPKQSPVSSPQSTVKTSDSQPSANNSGPSTIDYRLPTIDSRLSTLDSRLSTIVPRYRKFGINVITWLYNLGSKVKVSDAQSGFRAYNRKVLHAFPITEKGMGISVEVIIKARKKGFTIKEVPISCLYHPQGSSLNPVVHGLGVAFTVIKLRLLRRITTK